MGLCIPFGLNTTYMMFSVVMDLVLPLSSYVVNAHTYPLVGSLGKAVVMSMSLQMRIMYFPILAFSTESSSDVLTSTILLYFEWS